MWLFKIMWDVWIVYSVDRNNFYWESIFVIVSVVVYIMRDEFFRGFVFVIKRLYFFVRLNCIN